MREPSSAAVSVCAFIAVCQPVVCISVCTEDGVKVSVYFTLDQIVIAYLLHG